MKIKWLFMILVVACVGSFAEETVSLATLQESAAKGDAQAQFNLGYRYTLKEDLDLPKAFTWFKKAGDQNHAEAQYYVGLMYKSGQGVEKNPEASMAWLKMAAHQNHIMAQVKIGMSYYMGNSGVEMDLKESAKWFVKAADQGFSPAQYMLGTIYNLGTEELKDPDKSKYWIEKAAFQANAAAMKELGVYYYQGIGVEKDIVESYKWLRLAQSFGHTGAKEAANFVTKEMSEAQVDQGRAEAVQWKLAFDKKKKAEEEAAAKK